VAEKAQHPISTSLQRNVALQRNAFQINQKAITIISFLKRTYVSQKSDYLHTTMLQAHVCVIPYPFTRTTVKRWIMVVRQYLCYSTTGIVYTASFLA
jgi:hypothetical protein